ncbi:MAG: phosphatidate cytidylyltransferase [Phycisphaerales bacterium]|nr:phosphatidate cytidylyltransferase [Phycisphaerales bacterium]
MMRTRLVVGALLIAALAALAAIDSAIPYLSIGAQRIGPGAILILVSLLLISVILAREFSRLTAAGGRPLAVWIAYIAIAGGVASVALVPTLLPRHFVAPTLLTLPFALVALCALNHARTTQVSGMAHAIGSALLAYGAIGIPLGFWILLRHDRDAWTLAGAILCVKSGDIGGYFTGMAFGRHKMIPWLSPGKSWEGFAGGVVLSALTGGALALASQSALAADAYVEPISVAYGIFVAVALGLVGVCGDLFESCLKRAAGVKDSGNILPGMGGLYDLFDSLLPAGPVAWWFLTLGSASV